MKTLLLGIVGFLALAAVVLWALPYITNLGAVRAQAATAASEALQRPVTINRLSLRAIPSPGVQIEGLGIAEKDGVPIMTVDQIITEVKLAPLFQRKLVVDRIIVNRPRLTLTRNPDGSLNLPLPPPSAKPPTPGPPTGDGAPPLTLALEETRVENGEVTIRERHKSGPFPLLHLQGLDIALKDVSLAPPAAKPGGDAPPAITRLTAGGTLAARAVTAEAITVENLRTNLSIKGGVARLDNLALSLFGGKGSGRLLADMSQATQRMESAIKLETLQMEKVLRAVQPDSPATISGTASFQEALTMQGMKPDEIMRTLTGTARFEVKDGTIRKMETLGKILSVLNLKRLFTGTLPDMSKEGVPFDKISGTMQFKNGLMTTDDLALHSPSLDVAVKGSVSLPDRKLNLVASAMGLDFDVQGSADNPTVSSRAAKGIQEGVGNLLEKGLGLFR